MELERNGVATVVFSTTRFAELTQRVADGLGVPGLRTVVVPHPLGGTDEATVASWADTAVDAVMEALGAC